MNNLIGYTWLSNRFNFTHNHFHASKIGGRLKTEVAIDGSVTDFYTQQYYPGDAPLAHIEFALKYDGLDLALLKQVFGVLPAAEVVSYINQRPTGRYTRQIGFLYEFLTGNELQGVNGIAGNYIDVADGELYVLPQGVRNTKWRVNNNLPGSSNFCPLVRKTDAIKYYLDVEFGEMLQEVSQDIPPDIFRRAVNYFYFKETRSSNEIEREKPSPQKEELFVSLLHTAGSIPLTDRLSEKNLVTCQNAITDPRFHDEGFRATQNYVGESTAYGRRPIIHLIGLPPQFIQETMEGLAKFADISSGMNAIIRAVCISFGFVFIHPFDDGNGRIHRFLLNDVLASDGILKEGVILPVSAVMLKHHADYDRALERFSKPLMASAFYELDEDERIAVRNPEVIALMYQFPDMTAQAEYMFTVVEDTIKSEIVAEFEIIQAFDRFRSDVKDIIDMPNRDLELLVKVIYQGQGVLSQAKRDKFFHYLSDDEVTQIETAYKEAFRMRPNKVNKP
jgi:hypothetical protein